MRSHRRHPPRPPDRRALPRLHLNRKVRDRFLSKVRLCICNKIGIRATDIQSISKVASGLCITPANDKIKVTPLALNVPDFELEAWAT